MELVMIKKKGCQPCRIYEPTVKEVSKINNINFKAIQAEDMPEKIRPEIFPYFYLRNKNEIIESWAGTNERKMYSVLKRNIKNFKEN
tara:strand:+ start:277 stop:537 length:261 start_codon:yes stop_codon:yes gene_type:complete